MTACPRPLTSNPWNAHSARIVACEPELPGVATYHIQLSDPAARAAYDCRPGQFNMLYIPGVGESAISISRHDVDRQTWLHTIRTAGSVTQSIQQLGVGGSLAVRGPFGTGWPLDELRGRDVIFVAGGIGLAPLRPAIEWAIDRRASLGTITLIYGARAPSSMLFQRQFTEWTARGLRLETIVDRAEAGWTGNIGVVPLLIDRLRPLVAQQSVLLMCGPEVMMRYSAASALDREVSPLHIWVALERNMQCAVGFCGHCQLGPAFVCKDGPVFRYDRIAPYLSVEGL